MKTTLTGFDEHTGIDRILGFVMHHGSTYYIGRTADPSTDVSVVVCDALYVNVLTFTNEDLPLRFKEIESDPQKLNEFIKKHLDDVAREYFILQYEIVVPEGADQVEYIERNHGEDWKAFIDAETRTGQKKDHAIFATDEAVRLGKILISDIQLDDIIIGHGRVKETVPKKEESIYTIKFADGHSVDFDMKRVIIIKRGVDEELNQVRELKKLIQNNFQPPKPEKKTTGRKMSH